MTGRSVGSDANPLSCFLFRPRKRLEKRKKRSHTNVSNASATGLRRLWNKRPTFAFTSESGYTLGAAQRIAHNGSHGETRGVLGEGGIITLGAFRTFTNIPGPGVRTANFAGSGVLIWCTPEERREPAGQRCAHARRCSEASRPRRAA